MSRMLIASILAAGLFSSFAVVIHPQSSANESSSLRPCRNAVAEPQASIGFDEFTELTRYAHLIADQAAAVRRSSVADCSSLATLR